MYLKFNADKTNCFTLKAVEYNIYLNIPYDTTQNHNVQSSVLQIYSQ